MVRPGDDHLVVSTREDDTIGQDTQILNRFMMTSQNLMGSDLLYLAASVMGRVPLLGVPNDNVAIVTA